MSNNGVKQVYFTGLFNSWCHRKYPLKGFPTSPRRALLPLPPCKPTSPSWTTSTVRALHNDHRHHPPSLLWQTRPMKIKRCTLSSTTGGPGYLSESSTPGLKRIKTQNMLPSIFPEHFWFVIDSCRWKHAWKKCAEACGGVMERAKRLSDRPQCRRGGRRRLAVMYMHSTVLLNQPEIILSPSGLFQAMLLFIINFFGLFLLFFSSPHTWLGGRFFVFYLFNFVGQFL